MTLVADRTGVRGLVRRYAPLLVPGLTLLTAATNGSAQHAERMWAGARLGFASSSFGSEYDRIVPATARTTLTVAGVFGANILPFLAVQPELVYVQKGAEGSSDTGEFTIDLQYLELQLPLVLTVPIRESRFRPRLYSGVTLAIELDCDLEGAGPDGLTSRECGFGESIFAPVAFTQTSLFETGWLMGGGLDFAIGPGAITVDVRYNIGLSDINDLPGFPVRIKNRTLQVYGGYILYFGGPYKPPRKFGGE